MGCGDSGSFIVGRGGIDYNQNRVNLPSGQIRAGAFGAMCWVCVRPVLRKGQRV